MISFSVLLFFMAISIASLNVNGIAEAPSARVFTSLLALGFDVFVLQETHLASASLGKSWEQEWGSCAVWSPGTNRSAGVAFLVHPKCSVEISDFRVDVARRVLTVKLTLDSKPFKVINVYAPNLASEREIFFDNLWCYTFRNIDSIVVGDFNCIPDLVKDKWGGDDSVGDKAITQLHAFTESLNLEDFYRVSNPSGRLFTWFNSQHSVGCRLDRFYTPRAWRPHVRDFRCTPFAYSDHQIIARLSP